MDMSQVLVLAMAAHVALAGFLYALLTVARAPVVWGIGRRADGSNPWAAVEPRISANLSNQFKWPLLFYAACLILLNLEVGPTAVALAWVFVAGRLLHSGVQILTPMFASGVSYSRSISWPCSGCGSWWSWPLAAGRWPDKGPGPLSLELVCRPARPGSAIAEIEAHAGTDGAHVTTQLATQAHGEQVGEVV